MTNPGKFFSLMLLRLYGLALTMLLTFGTTSATAGKKTATMSQAEWHQETLAIHAGAIPDSVVFEVPPDCEANVGYDIAELGLSAEDHMVSEEIRIGSKWALMDGQNAASDYNRLADIEERRHCYELSRKIYLQVIETYVGAGYEAMRQRAEIGVNDLRSETHR